MMHPFVLPESLPERELSELREHSLDLELCRFTFAGVVPASADSRRRLTAACRERVLVGLLRALRDGEALEMRYRKSATGRLEWEIAGLGKDQEGSNPVRSAELSLGWQTALHELRFGYRFAPHAAVVAGTYRPSQEFTPIRAGGHWVHLGTGQMGFANGGQEKGLAVRLPMTGGATQGRAFLSLADLVFAAPVPVELHLRVQPITLPVKSGELAAALGWIRRQPRTATLAVSTESWCDLLERWLQCRAGFRLSANLAAEHPLPTSFQALAAGEVFGSVPELHDEAIAAEKTLDLSDCVPAGAALPVLFPPVEHLLAEQARRVFNIALPELACAGPQLGTASAGSVAAPVNLPAEGRGRHCYIVGATGTGKSTLLLNLIIQDLAAGEGIALIDPHGDLYEQVLRAMPARRIDDVILIEPGRGHHVPGINFLNIPEGPSRRTQVNFVINQFLGMFEQLYDMRECGGPMFQTYFRNALLLLIESRCPNVTLLDLARVFEDRAFRDELKAHCPDRQVVHFWTHQAERTSGDSSLANLTPYITSKLNLLVQSGPMRPIVGQTRTTIDFRGLIDNRGILLVNLAKGLIGEMDTQLLGMVLIGQLFAAALGRATLRPERRAPFHLYVDEFQNFVTDGVASLLAEARKFGLHLTLANQTLAQLNAHHGRQNLLETILGNVGNLVLFRLGVPDAQRLRMFTEPQLPPEEVQRLPNFHAFARLLTAQGPVEPFVFATDPPRSAHRNAAQRVAEIRRRQLHWSRSVAEVEREIADRFDVPRWPARSASSNGNDRSLPTPSPAAKKRVTAN